MLPQRRQRDAQRRSNPLVIPARRQQHADAIPVFDCRDMLRPTAPAAVGRNRIAEQVKNITHEKKNP
jgi:hypothetical protein